MKLLEENTFWSFALEQSLKAYLSRCHDPVLIFTPEGKCRFANPRARELFGYGTAPLDGVDLVKLFPFGYRTSDRQKLREIFESILSNTPSMERELTQERRYTLMGRTSADVDFPSRVGVFALPSGDETLVALVVRATYGDQVDTEALLSPQREQMEAELQSGTQKVKSEFLGMAIHDLRTPIHKISLASDILLNEKFDEARKREFLEMIGRAAVGMGDLVNDLLDLTKIESGKINLSREPTDMNFYLEDLCSSMAILANSKNISITCHVDDDVPIVQLDQKRVSQVVNNFLSNAMKFSEENTKIQVRARLEGPRIVVEVEDQGPGIPEGEEDKLFEAFSRSSNRPTGGEHSTGLGLAISKRIVDLHGGEVGVRSVPGQGSTFFFSLPVP